jgi:hypothetical protein
MPALSSSLPTRAFTLAELTAGLRSHSGDPWLQINKVIERPLTGSRLSAGRVYSLKVLCSGAIGTRTYNLVMKEPCITQRTGMPEAAQREVAFYRCLADQLPVRVPGLIAAQAQGEWLAFEHLQACRPPEEWTAGDYRLAAEQLAALHDRFWGLGEHLENFTWLAWSLDQRQLRERTQLAYRRLLARLSPGSPFPVQQVQALGVMVSNLDRIAAAMQSMPASLLHGDYWPGNLCVDRKGRLSVFDWQNAAIGPGILDLAALVQNSLWSFSPLPLPVEEIIETYRTALAGRCGQRWDEEEWSRLWDHAVMWLFLTGWLGLLAEIPTTVLNFRYPQLHAVWLQPVEQAVYRNLR